MSTAKQQPATPYDAEIESNRQSDAAESSYEKLMRPYKREGYLRALADLAPLHRQMVEALEAALLYWEDGTTGAITDAPLPAKLRAALDAARKAGL